MRSPFGGRLPHQLHVPQVPLNKEGAVGIPRGLGWPWRLQVGKGGGWRTIRQGGGLLRFPVHTDGIGRKRRAGCRCRRSWSWSESWPRRREGGGRVREGTREAGAEELLIRGRAGRGVVEEDMRSTRRAAEEGSGWLCGEGRRRGVAGEAQRISFVLQPSHSRVYSSRRLTWASLNPLGLPRGSS